MTNVTPEAETTMAETKPDTATLLWRIRGRVIDYLDGPYERRSLIAERIARDLMYAPEIHIEPGRWPEEDDDA